MNATINPWEVYCAERAQNADSAKEKLSWQRRALKGEETSFNDVLHVPDGADMVTRMKAKYERWKRENGMNAPLPVFVAAPPIPETPAQEEETPAPVVQDTSVPDITDRITLGGKHNRTNLIRAVLRRRKFPFMHGSPGSGKTHLAMSLAHDMELPFVLFSCAEDVFKSEIIGSVSPVNGEYYTTAVRQAWEFGGVVLFDECGNSSGGFLNTLNAGLAQGFMQFPDGRLVERHENCFILFADNSTLYGNDPRFPERKDAGGAFRDRLTYIAFPYDLTLERMILAKIFGSSSDAALFHARVLELREWLEQKGDLPVFASPRFAYAAAQWYKDGINMKEILEMELYRGISEDVLLQVRPVAERIFLR